MRTISALFFYILITTGCAFGQKETDMSNDIIYVVEQNARKNKIKIGFIDKKDSAKYFVSTKIIKDGDFSYIKIGGERYYLNCDTPPPLLDEICAKLKKTESDTTIRFGEPLTKSISMVLLISNTGGVTNFGIARTSNDPYYDDKALQLLKSYYKGKSEPAKLHGNYVSYLLRLSFNFSEGTCFTVGY